eukprot:symbB.v1.2.007345.t1/scaffold425.1/size368629/9
MAKIESMLKEAEDNEKEEQDTKGSENKKKKTLKDIIAQKKESRKEKRKEKQQKDLGRPLTSKEKLKLKLKNIKEQSLTRKKNGSKHQEKSGPTVKSTPCMFVTSGNVCPHAQCRFSHAVLAFYIVTPVKDAKNEVLRHKAWCRFARLQLPQNGQIASQILQVSWSCWTYLGFKLWFERPSEWYNCSVRAVHELRCAPLRLKSATDCVQDRSCHLA